MKKKTALALALTMLGAALPVFAITPDEAKENHFKEMKAIKEKQRTEREARKKEEATRANAPHEKSFWEKEGERSGLGQSGGRLSRFLSNLNPVPFFKDQEARYKERKAGAASQSK